VVELKSHPRFTIGESTVPSTTITFHHLGEAYGVPELTGLTNYCDLMSQTEQVNAFAKTHFWFGVHKEGEKLNPLHESLFETFAPPMGPDTHLNRADLDEYLVSLFPKYGVHYMCNTSVKEFNNDEQTGIEAVLSSKPDGSQETITDVHVEYAVDCTGHAAFLSRKFGLLQKEPKLKTKTRTIYGHFEYDKISFDLDRIMGGPNPAFRFSRTQGTGHHCFDGGWIWVIPFDNSTVSIGIVLDVVKYPLNQEISKEDEFQMVIDRYPTIKEHFQHVRPLMELRRGNRMQLRSNTVLGPRFILTPHASNFIDPLFSTGITMTSRFIARFMPKIKEAFKTKNFSQEFFRPIENNMFRELKHADRLVSGTIESHHNYEVFKQYWRLWIESSFRDLCDVAGFRLYGAPLFGSHDEKWYRLVKECWKLAFSPQARQNPDLVAAQLKRNIDANPDSKIPIIEYGLHESKALCVPNYARTQHEIRTMAYLNPLNILITFYVIVRFVVEYWLSWLFGTRYHKYVDRVFAARTPGNRFIFDLFSAPLKSRRAAYVKNAMPLTAPKTKDFMMC